MPVISYEVYINAPIEVCFDLTRDVEIHTKTTAKTKERAVAGVTSGLMEEGDQVTWEAVHLGIKQKLTAKIIEGQALPIYGCYGQRCISLIYPYT